METRTGSTDLSLRAEHEGRGDKHSGISLQENMDKITLIASPFVSICSPFIFPFCITTAFLPHSELLFVSELSVAFSKKIENYFGSLIYFKVRQKGKSSSLGKKESH